MKINTLKQQVELTSQYRLAIDLGITAGAVGQALEKSRSIYIVTDDENKMTAFEIKPAFNTDPDMGKVNEIIEGA